MQTQPLGDSDLQVSPMGLGCVTFGREIERDTSFAILDQALLRGITLLDTAEAYGEGASETIVGEWMQTRGTRDQVVLATKVAPPLDRERVLASANESLKRLQLEQVDLFQPHSFDPDTPLEETLQVLDELVQTGRTRFIGCSNFSHAQLSRALALQRRNGWAPFISTQCIYNLVHREIEADVVPLCQAAGLGLITYSPLGAGFLTGKYQPGQNAPKGSRFDVKPGHKDIYYSAHGFAVVEALRRQAEKTRHSIIHLALHWALHQSGPTCVLIGARTPDHVDQAFMAEALDVDHGWVQSITNIQ